MSMGQRKSPVEAAVRDLADHRRELGRAGSAALGSLSFRQRATPRQTSQRKHGQLAHVLEDLGREHEE
jgi:hypothetical protein